tara:strand:+ start:3070 stop:3258 length:189 start_codon:yes stop_codon:yes gene_type:complete
MENVEIKDVKKKKAKKTKEVKQVEKASTGMNGKQKFMVHINNKKAQYGHPAAYTQEEINKAK